MLLGAGTAMVYPTLLAAIGDVAHPAWRARSVGVYRLWRDGGFAVGALLAGIIADAFGIPAAIWAVAALTAASGLVVAVRMYETRPAPARPQRPPPETAGPGVLAGRGQLAAVFAAPGFPAFPDREGGQGDGDDGVGLPAAQHSSGGKAGEHGGGLGGAQQVLRAFPGGGRRVQAGTRRRLATPIPA